MTPRQTAIKNGDISYITSCKRCGKKTEHYTSRGQCIMCLKMWKDMPEYKQLKKWSQILSSITEIDREIERAHTEYLSFMEPRNILMTTLLITNREKRLNIIEDHLENKDNLNPETILSNFENDIRKEFKNKNFKLVA